MKNFNQKFAEHPELSVFKEFFLSHGKYKEIKKKEYLVEQSSVASICRRGLFQIYTNR